MKKNIKNSIWTMAITIASFAMPLAACSSDDDGVSMRTEDSLQEETRLFLVAIARCLQDCQKVMFTKYLQKMTLNGSM